MLLFVHALERGLKRARAAEAHLDDDDEIILRRDEIDLEPPDANVRTFDDEAARDEMLSSRRLSATAANRARLA